MTTSNIVLNVNGIEVIYNHVILVLKGVSLQVPQGRIVAILGGNGAGKTTTLRAVSNLLAGERGAVTKGTIELRGERIEALTPAALVQRWARAYGSRAERVLGTDGLGAEVAPGLFEAELRHLHRCEWARSADDVLWRRSKLGLHFTPTERSAVARWCDAQWGVAGGAVAAVPGSA